MILCLEGINGCGKSAQVARITEYLDQKDIRVNSFYDPGVADHHRHGQMLRQAFVYETYDNPMTSVLIGSAARSVLTETVRKSQQVDPNCWILLDRYELSLWAYQTLCMEDSGMTLTQAMDRLLLIRKLVPCVAVDHLFFIDTQPERAYERRHGGRRVVDRSEDDQFEARGLEFLTRLRARYLEMLKFPTFGGFASKIMIVDGNRSVDEVFTDIRQVLDSYVQASTAA